MDAFDLSTATSRDLARVLEQVEMALLRLADDAAHNPELSPMVATFEGRASQRVSAARRCLAAAQGAVR